MLKDLLHLFYPNLCEGCRQPLVKGEDVICIGCEAHLPVTDYTKTENETAMLLWGRVPYKHATSLLYFTDESLTQHLIHRLKYKERKPIGTYIGKQLARRVAGWQVDAVIPVPLYKKKEAKRGFNQSTVIAEGISMALNVPVWTDVLHRARHTETQTDKNREERIANVADAFIATTTDKAKGKHLLLIDDVLTTGATIEACANALAVLPHISISVATAGIAVH